MRKLKNNVSVFLSARDLENLNELDETWEEDEERESTQFQDIRRLSNVIQALENLMTQCSGHETFASLQEFAEKAHRECRQQLILQIHHPATVIAREQTQAFV